MLGPLFINKRRGRREADILLGSTRTEEHNFVDFFTVDGHRHRLAKLQVTEDFALFQILRGHVKGKG